MALLAAAKATSDSLIEPTPPCITLTCTSSLESLTSDSFTASTEPCTSALIITGSSFKFPALICVNRSSRLSFALVSSISLFLFSDIKVAANALASLSFSVATKISPALGTLSSPSISTGVDGVACFNLIPLSFIIARTLPEQAPAAIKSPT